MILNGIPVHGYMDVSGQIVENGFSVRPIRSQ